MKTNKAGNQNKKENKKLLERTNDKTSIHILERRENVPNLKTC